MEWIYLLIIYCIVCVLAGSVLIAILLYMNIIIVKSIIHLGNQKKILCVPNAAL